MAKPTKRVDINNVVEDDFEDAPDGGYPPPPPDVSFSLKTGEQNNAALRVFYCPTGAGYIDVKLETEQNHTDSRSNHSVFTVGMGDDLFAIDTERGSVEFKTEFRGGYEMVTFIETFVAFGKALEEHQRLLNRTKPEQ